MPLKPVTTKEQKYRILTLLTCTSVNKAGVTLKSALRKDFDAEVAKGKSTRQALKDVLAGYNYDFTPTKDFGVDGSEELHMALFGDTNYTPSECPDSHVVEGIIG